MTLQSLGLLVLGIMLSLPLAGQTVRIPARVRHTLDNGLLVILMKYDKVPIIHFRLVARGGSGGDPEGREGAASMVASLMREGTARRSAIQIAEEIDFTGGTLTTGAGLDYCAVNCQVLKKHAAVGLELFADIVLNPAFPEEELARERKQRVAQLDALLEDPGSVAGIVFNRSVYGSHPYGRQSFGTRVSLERLERGNLLEFYREIFVPDNCIVVVVGDFDGTEMLSQLSARFGGWKRESAKRQDLPAPHRVPGRKVIVVDKPDATQAQICLGNIGIDIRHPDNFPVDVANGVFGNGFTSRLVDELRVKRSLTYSAGSSFGANLYGGTYSISTFTKNETIGETVDVVLEELKKFREHGGTRDEVRKAQNYLAGNFARGLQTPEALAASLTDIEVYGLPADYLETYIEKLKSVTPADVRRVAQQYFLLEDLVLVFVAPLNKAENAVRGYGPVNVEDLRDAVR
jgi:zinc protease